ncbi:MAG: DUF4388 domain-containing protein [Thermoanaerobaculia bacterium]
MALEGTLKDFSLADIFQLIGLQRKTGVLTLRGKEDTVTVTFLEGRVVAADSLNKRLENRLGRVLLKTAMLTEEQLSRALEIQKETLQRLGFILTHYGIISQDNLREALHLQILQIIYRLFRWKDGEYHFSQETTIEYDRDVVVPITAESILMEGARMIDEWPIIEKRVRSFDMMFRKKLIDQEITVVADDDADDFDFDETSSRKAKKTSVLSPEKIRITAQEKAIYDLVDGTLTVGEIVDGSRQSEFDTCKGLYELLTRDLIEEVRTKATPVVEMPVDQTAPTEIPEVLPLPLIVLLALIALGSLVTSFLNPLNHLQPFQRRSSAIVETQKAISMQRLESVRQAIEAYTLTHGGTAPIQLQQLVPYYTTARMLEDPWGNTYKYLQRPDRYLVIGFGPEGRPDTDLFLSHLKGEYLNPSSTPPTGGITLVD